HAAVEQRAGGLPRSGKLPRDPAVLLCPLPLRVGARAVVANAIGELELVDALVPVPSQRGEGGWDAGQVVLAHEADLQEHACAATTGRYPVRQLREEGGVCRPRLRDRAARVPQVIGSVRAQRREPLAELRIGKGEQRLRAVDGRIDRGVPPELELQARGF